MKINAKLSISIRDDAVHIDIHDEDAVVCVVDLTVSHVDFIRAMGGLHRVNTIDAKVCDPLKIGKVREHKVFEFECPSEGDRYKDHDATAKALSVKLCPEGWESDQYFGSQGSYFERDGKKMARCTICRWVGKKASVK